MRISKNGHEITVGEVISITEWDKELGGYAGNVDYERDEKWYAPKITKAELAQIAAETGIKPSKIEVGKYTETY